MEANEVPVKQLPLRMKLAKARKDSPEEVFEYIRQTVFGLLDTDKNDEARSLLEEWGLDDAQKARFVIPLTMPKISALSAGREGGCHMQLIVNGKVFDNNKIVKNCDGGTRGMNLFLIDHVTHEVVKSQSYDTHASDQDDSDFCQAL